jgi:hypothetical protein
MSMALSAHRHRDLKPKPSGFFFWAGKRFCRWRGVNEEGHCESNPECTPGTLLLLLVVPIRGLLNGKLRKLARGP